MRRSFADRPRTAPMRVLDDLDSSPTSTGEELGTSDWLEIDQDRVTRSPTPPATTSGSTSTSSARRPARSAAPSPTATSRCRWSRTSAARCSARDPGRQAQLRREQGPLPAAPSGSARASAATWSIGEVTDLPAGKQLTLQTHHRDRGPGQARLRRRDGRPPAPLAIVVEPRKTSVVEPRVESSAQRGVSTQAPRAVGRAVGRGGRPATVTRPRRPERPPTRSSRSPTASRCTPTPRPRRTRPRATPGRGRSARARRCAA